MSTREQLIDLLIRYDVEHPATLGDAVDVRNIYADRILELLNPPGIVVTPEEAAAAVYPLRYGKDEDGWNTPPMRALAEKLERASTSDQHIPASIPGVLPDPAGKIEG